MSRKSHSIALAFFATVLIAGCVTAPPAKQLLAGTSWRVLSIDGKPAISPNARVNFRKAAVEATAGCNQMNGAISYRPDSLLVEPLMATRMYCDGLMEQESALSELLSGDPRFDLGVGMLRLESAGHRAELRPD